MDLTRLWAQYREELTSDPLLVLSLSAALVALATTPLAFAILGRMDWFKARRGRVLQRPEFWSVVTSMLLVMGIPAIFAALVLKSRSFDRDRYEFDPNRTWSVLEQGRGFQSLKEADSAVKQEMERLALERKNLVENVKKLDEAMLALRSVANTSPLVAQRLPNVLQSLAGVRKSVGVDGPQQLLDYTAPPVDMRALALNTGQAATSLPAAAPGATPPTAATAAAHAPASNGLTPAEISAELATVPEPQRGIAAMLPLADLPPEWTVAKSGDRHLETFNADNLYEKIDGRAESFIQYGVKGMAYAFYHPAGDPSNELQLYIFEMADPLKALGKYGSEKPDEFTPVAIGSEGYTSAGSLLFHAGRYYAQIVSTQDDPKFAAFALELGRRVASRQKPGGAAAPAPLPSPETAGSPGRVVASAKTAKPAASTAKPTKPASETATREEPIEEEGKAVVKPTEISPATFFAFLPAQDRQGDAKYVAQDVFGYSFLSDVFMADYKSGETTWQGFLRPYRNADEAKAVLAKYIDGVKKDGAQVQKLEVQGADEMVKSDNIGLTDFIFRKGNTLAGANGATSPGLAETFTRNLAKSLPGAVPTLDSAN
jgi:hypothetical protein